MKIKVLTAVILALIIIAVARGGNAEIKNFPNGNNAVVAFGDSLTYGHGASRGGSYPELLQAKTGRRVINLGINGDTTPGGAGRIQSVLEHKPYMVLIEFGGNDFMKKVPFDSTKTALTQIVDAVQAAGAIAVIVDTGGAGAMDRYSKFNKQLAKEKGAIFVPAIMKGIMGDNSLKSDQIHPNGKGYEIVAERVYKEIKDYL